MTRFDELFSVKSLANDFRRAGGRRSMGARQAGRGKRAGDDSMVQVQAEIRDGVEQERLKRYAREYKQSVEMEEALAGLSKFTYQEVDYLPAMARKEWTEPTIPDFSYILVETRLKVTNKFLPPS
jgi:hypothetical protein